MGERAKRKEPEPPDFVTARENLRAKKLLAEIFKRANSLYLQIEEARADRRYAEQVRQAKAEGRPPPPRRTKRPRPLQDIMRDEFVAGRYERCHDAAIRAVLTNESWQHVHGAQSVLADDLKVSEEAASQWAQGLNYMDASNWSLFTALKGVLVRQRGRVNLRDRALAGYRNATFAMNRLLRGTQAIWKEEANKLYRHAANNPSARDAKKEAVRCDAIAEMVGALLDAPDVQVPLPDVSAAERHQIAVLSLDMDFEILSWMIDIDDADLLSGKPRMTADYKDAMYRTLRTRFPAVLDSLHIGDSERLAVYAQDRLRSYLPGFLIACQIICLAWASEVTDV